MRCGCVFAFVIKLLFVFLSFSLFLFSLFLLSLLSLSLCYFEENTLPSAEAATPPAALSPAAPPGT